MSKVRISARLENQFKIYDLPLGRFDLIQAIVAFALSNSSFLIQFNTIFSGKNKKAGNVKSGD